MKITMLVLLVLTLVLYVGGKFAGGAKADMNALPFYVAALISGAALGVAFLIWVVIQIIKS